MGTMICRDFDAFSQYAVFQAVNTRNLAIFHHNTVFDDRLHNLAIIADTTVRTDKGISYHHSVADDHRATNFATYNLTLSADFDSTGDLTR